MLRLAFLSRKRGLHQLCSDAAKVLDVTVYGGDCIVAPDGTIRIIDLTIGLVLLLVVRKRRRRLVELS